MSRRSVEFASTARTNNGGDADDASGPSTSSSSINAAPIASRSSRRRSIDRQSMEIVRAQWRDANGELPSAIAPDWRSRSSTGSSFVRISSERQAVNMFPASEKEARHVTFNGAVASATASVAGDDTSGPSEPQTASSSSHAASTPQSLSQSQSSLSASGPAAISLSTDDICVFQITST